MVDDGPVLVPCSNCRRHVRVNETACPFCGVAARPARRGHGGVGILLGAALGVSACDKSGAEGLELGRHIALTTQLSEAQVENARLQEETRRKEQALREAMAQGYSREERDRLQAELERVRAPKAVYGAPPPRSASSIKKPCGCTKGDPLCSCL